jgi:hypothetical protein
LSNTPTDLWMMSERATEEVRSSCCLKFGNTLSTLSVVRFVQRRKIEVDGLLVESFADVNPDLVVGQDEYIAKS